MKKGLIGGPFPFAGIDWIAKLDLKWPVIYAAYTFRGQALVFSF